MRKSPFAFRIRQKPMRHKKKNSTPANYRCFSSPYFQRKKKKRNGANREFNTRLGQSSAMSSRAHFRHRKKIASNIIFSGNSPLLFPPRPSPARRLSTFLPLPCRFLLVVRASRQHQPAREEEEERHTVVQYKIQPTTN